MVGQFHPTSGLALQGLGASVDATNSIYGNQSPQSLAQRAQVIADCTLYGPFAYLSAACRNAYAEAAADVYDYRTYGSSPGGASPAQPPGPGAPGSTAQENMDAYVRAQQEAIRRAEAEGYHTNPSVGTTFQDLSDDLDNTFKFSMASLPWIAGGLVLLFVMTRR